MRRATLFLTLLVLTACGTAVPPEHTGGLPVALAERIPGDWQYDMSARATIAPNGMVVTDAALATRVGRTVLERGGNVIDAVVATAFALAVVYPEAGNLGGGGFMVTTIGDTVAALDFREKAPLAATADMFLNEQGEPTNASRIGPLASGVPGSVAGLREAWERFGTMPWEDLLAPAIDLAANGFVVSEHVAGHIANDAEELARFAGSAELFLPGGEPIEAGEVWKNPDLAATLRRIAENGAAGFYQGETADLFVETMERTGGIITHEDLRRYEAQWREPIEFDYRGYTIIGMPPPSSGGITMAIMANILEGWNLGELGWHSPRSLHLLTEAMRRAYAVRNHFLGDPDFEGIPRDRLLSEAFAGELRATITERATPSMSIAFATGRDSRTTFHTTHISIVGDQGNAVALTTTINSLHGSKVTVAGAGFLLNNEMNDFTANPGEPNEYGLVQGDVNAIEPGKRMLSSQSPTVVLGQDGAPLIVTGARGGQQIITAVFQVISNIVDHGFDVVEAVRAPRIHNQHLPDHLLYEPNGLTNELILALDSLGYDIEAGGMVGHAPTIVRRGDAWLGTPDPRDGGRALGY